MPGNRVAESWENIREQRGGGVMMGDFPLYYWYGTVRFVLAPGLVYAHYGQNQ